jgi:hypothetical protein
MNNGSIKLRAWSVDEQARARTRVKTIRFGSEARNVKNAADNANIGPSLIRFHPVFPRVHPKPCDQTVLAGVSFTELL